MRGDERVDLDVLELAQLRNAKDDRQTAASLVAAEVA